MSTVYEQLSWRTLALPGEAGSGTARLHVGEVGVEGPLALLTAGIHGDEGPWGALALKQVLDAPHSNLKGRLQVVFAANPLAIQTELRNAPADTLDLNRSLPGDPTGSYTEVLAEMLAPFARAADVVIDLHGGGSWCVNAFVFRFEGSEALAETVGAPFIVDAPDKGGTLTQYARAHGARVVAIEMGGRSRAELVWRDRISAGVRRVLGLEGILSVNVDAVDPGQAVGPSAVLRPPSGGIFVPTLREESVGTVVEQGTELGTVLDMNTLVPLHTFAAPYAQTALLLLRPHIGVIEGGAMTYVVAELRKGPS